MRDSFKLGLTTCSLFVAASAAASAADLGHGTNGVNAIVTQSTCGSLSPTLVKGTNVLTTILYPGPGKKATLISPGTTSKSSAGGATTSVCLAKTNSPAGGLGNATVSFTCYGDTASGPGKSPQATIKATFKIGASHVAGTEQVSVKSSLYIGTAVTPTCTFTSDGTATVE